MKERGGEAEWVAAAKRGCEEAWTHLIQAHQDRLFRLAWMLTGRRDLAADVTQDTFLEAIVRIGQLRSNAAFRHWITTILVRTARRTWDGGDVPLEIDLPDPRTPDQEAARHELEDAIDEAIQSLPPLYRAALALSMEQDLTSAEAGELLGCSAEAYRVRLHKARKWLRERLEGYL
jgi:RNA polymerase sigma-70 factor (ECF subfamily)